MKEYYHVTQRKNMQSINEKGLIPLIGPRAAAGKETVPTVYLFESKDDMEYALTNWLGEELGEDELVLLVISIPHDYQAYIHRTNAGYERTCTRPIPPCLIRFFDEEWNETKIKKEENYYEQHHRSVEP